MLSDEQTNAIYKARKLTAARCNLEASEVVPLLITIDSLESELRQERAKNKILMEALEKYATYPHDILYFDPKVNTDPREIVEIITMPIAKHAREALEAAEKVTEKSPTARQ